MNANFTRQLRQILAVLNESFNASSFFISEQSVARSLPVKAVLFGVIDVVLMRHVFQIVCSIVSFVAVNVVDVQTF